MSSNRLSGLDGVRGLAALAIVVHHVWWYDREIARPGFGIDFADNVFGHMRLGVTVFFVLSGFLLYRPYAGAILGRGPWPSLRRYAAGRVLRVVPAYWLALGILVVLFHRELLALDPGAVLRTFAFAQIYAETPAIIGPAWTLCLEVAFYAVLPVLALGIARIARGGNPARRQALALLAIVGGAVGYRLLASDGSVPPLALPAYLDQFAVGMLLAVAYERRSRWLRTPEAGCLAFAGIGVAVAATLAAQDDPSHTSVVNGVGLVYELLVAGAVGLVLAALLLAPASAALAGRSLAALGAVSYGVFLWHAPLLNAMRDGGLLLPRDSSYFAANLALVLAPTLLVSLASWKLIERPALALKNREPLAGEAPA